MTRLRLAVFVVLGIGLAATAVWANRHGWTRAVFVVALIAAILTALAWGLFTKQDKSRLGRLLKLKKADARDLGSSLLTGLLVAISVFGLQVYLERAREKDAQEQQLRLSIGLSRDLAGLDASGKNLSGISLAGKDLDRADLEGANLRNANLEGASLRETNLRNAHLDGASLYQANLARSQLSGAHFDGADLQFANLSDAEVYARDGYDDASFDGAEANARTCFPPDIITGLGEPNRSYREDQLQAKETLVHGEVKAPASIGYQCPFSFSDLIDDLLQYRKRGRTYEQLATPWQMPASSIARIFETPGTVPLRRQSVQLRAPVCPGATQISLRRTQWQTGGAFALLVRNHATPVDQTIALPMVTKLGGTFFRRIHIDEPLKRGATVILFATPNTDETGLNYAFVKRISVRRC